MRPGEVLDAQIDLLDRVEGNDIFRRVLEAWAGVELTSRTRRDQESFRASALLANHVRAAYAYRVTHDMSLMLQHLAAELDDTDRFMPDLAPTGCGIVCFDHPVPIKDIRGKTMLMHWLIWGPAQTQTTLGRRETGTGFWTFNDTWRQPDEVEIENRARRLEEVGGDQAKAEAFHHALGRWSGMIGFDLAFAEQRLGPLIIPVNDTQRAEYLAKGIEPVPGTNPLRYLHALWLLLNQTVAKVEPEEPDRPARRRAVKKRIPPQVTVIRLRREESLYERPEGESMVEWAHRWIVRRHWRWQPYGPRKADHAHIMGPIEAEQGFLVKRCVHEGCEVHEKRIVISPYVKGPEGAPLKQSEKVYSLDR